MTALIYIDIAAVVLLLGWLLAVEVAYRRRERRRQQSLDALTRDWQWPVRPNNRTGDQS